MLRGYSARIIAVANRKGGVGKSTTVVNLAAELANRGYRVLAVDLDPQGHAGLGLGILARAADKTAHSALVERQVWLGTSIRSTAIKNLDVLPADREFDGVIHASDPRCLAKALAPLRSRYDVILIDTPPGSANLIVCALLASDGVLVPTLLEHLSFDGVRQFSRTYHHVAMGLNAALMGLAIVPTRVDLRSKVQQHVLSQLNRGFGLSQVMPGIRVDISLCEAFGHHEPVRCYKSGSRAVGDFARVADDVIHRFACHEIGVEAVN
ncbi:ParA family protein [Lichenifustis flavocetrariae]|uniref:ParA family protein n=1 Tax=Lichenifustis flavocetrariae TaxID=2949735 RepID=A0AA41Z5N3_9HYPH|nr:ParA family protein [Lichenifustis flavocetrariae]MCW6509732.1 ParA family protein [Lichenifustis flavocetrariae]